IHSNRNVAFSSGPYQIRRHAKLPKLQSAECLEDFRTGVCGAAAVKHAGCRAMPHLIRIIVPPQHRLAARLVWIRDSATHGEPEVQRQLTSCDMWVRAIPNDS